MKLNYLFDADILYRQWVSMRRSLALQLKGTEQMQSMPPLEII